MTSEGTDVHSIFTTLNISEARLQEIDSRLFDDVLGFYNLAPTTKALSDEERLRRRLNHINYSERIGEGCDIQFLNHLTENNVDISNGIIDILPLRGAVSLVPGIETNSTNHLYLLNKRLKTPYNTELIGVKRNGQEANIYYPEVERLQFEPNKIYRIKDFGIATGGTTAELARLLIFRGVRPENIFVQGAVGTDMARNTIMAAMHLTAMSHFGAEYVSKTVADFTNNILFAVKG